MAALEWLVEENGVHVAFATVRTYRIRPVGAGMFLATVDGFRIGTRATLETAKQLCQEHRDR